MSEPNANAIKNPSRPATNVRTITSLAMLAAIAYVVMLLSKMLPQVSGFLQMDLKDTVICIGAFLACIVIWRTPEAPEKSKEKKS